MLFAAAITIAGIVSTGCRKVSDLSHYQPNVDTKSDSLRIFNLLPDSSYSNNVGYLLYVNDSLDMFQGRGVVDFNSCYGVPTALGIPTEGGTFTLKIASWKNSLTPPANADSVQTLCQTTITIPAHSGFGYLFVYDSATIPVMKYIPTSTADPGATRSDSRCVNASNRCSFR